VKIFQQKGVNKIVESHRKDLMNFGVSFDNWFYESLLYKNKNEKGQNKVEEILAMLESKEFTYTEDGARWFRSTAFGDDKDRVLIKADGIHTYIASDIAYHNDKFARSFTELVDIWGPDHHGYIARMRAAMQALGHPAEAFRVLIAQQVNLFEAGEPVAMSKRAGKFVTMADLIQDVGRDVARFFFLMRSTDAHLDFDLDLARKHTEENPVFYIQYAHARICSIIRKAQDEGWSLPPAGEAAVAGLTALPEELALARELAMFPEVLDTCARNLEPHGLAFYLKDVAAVFHRFYTVCRVLDQDERARSLARLGLVEAVRIVLRNGLNLLGISAPESM
jgi:arginyl-tRNA synthetase